MEIHERRLALKAHRSIQRNHIAVLTEACVIAEATAQCARFIAGSERATMDAGILIAEEVEDFIDETTRLFRLSDKHSSEKIIISLDIKSIVPHKAATIKGGLYFHRILLTPRQRTCTAFLIFNPAAPHLIAMVPQHYLDADMGDRTRMAYDSREAPIFDDAVDPFPMEWSPFVMPMACLGKSLDLLFEFAVGRVAVWSNPYNNLTFDTMPKPKAQSFDVLLPSSNAHQNEFQLIKSIWEILNSHSASLRLLLPQIQPMTGDFLIEQTRTGVQVMVELKALKTGSIADDWTLSHPNAIKYGGETQHIFSPLKKWDFLLSILQDGRAVMLSRDELPDNWFSEFNIDRLLTWSAGKAFMQLRVLRLHDPVLFVKDLEAIWTHHERADSLISRIKRSVTPEFVKFRLTCLKERSSSFDYGNSDLNDSTATTSTSDTNITGAPDLDIRDTSGPIVYRGFGRRWSKRMWEALEEEWLRRTCRESGPAAVYRMGYHPFGTHLLTMGIEQDRRPSFFDISLHTPFISINFAPVSHQDEFFLNDVRKQYSFIHATHGLKPSLYIMGAITYKLPMSANSRYVVPSNLLATEKYYKINKDYFEKGPVPTSNSKSIQLVNNDSFEVFNICAETMISEIRKLFAAPMTETRVPFGNSDIEPYLFPEPGKFVTTKLEVLQAYLDLYTSKTCWSRVGLKVRPETSDTQDWDEQE